MQQPSSAPAGRGESMSGNGGREEGSSEPKQPAKKRSKVSHEEETAEQKKQRACWSCRRAKLRCVMVEDGEPCKRCSARGEECKFKIPLHDEKWQEATNSRLEYLLSAVQQIAHHLNIELPPTHLPPLPGLAAPLPVRRHTPDSLNSPGNEVEQSLQLEHREPSPNKRARVEHDYSTQTGAEELLAQAYARFSPLMAKDYSALPPVASTSSQQIEFSSAVANAALKETQDDPGSFFGMLEDSSASPETPSRSNSITMADKMRKSVNLDAVGSADPRGDVVKSGVVMLADAENLVDYFHAHLAHHFFGFPLRLKSWPYLPAGKSTITPLIFGSICLVSSERIRHYHSLISRLESSDLSETVLNATPGLSFAPNSSSNSNTGASNSLEPDLDLELGIGPEEIASLLIYSSLSHSSRSDVIARTAFEWTRGYLKTFMLPSPPPITYGEVFGLLTPRRSLTFENWLRLWLFGYVVDVQQSLHHEHRGPIFDPTYFSDVLILNASGISSPAEQINDRELVAHARLCSLLQKIQHTRAIPNWAESQQPANLIRTYEQWVLELDHWWNEQQQQQGEGNNWTQSAEMSLTLFRLFARNYINLAASRERVLGDDPVRWRFKAASVKAAFDLLKFVGQEPYTSYLNVLLPFYVKMVSLACVVLLEAIQYSVFVYLPCSPERAIEMVAQVADNLSQSPTPPTHACHTACSTIRKRILKAQKDMMQTGNGVAQRRPTC